MFDHISKHRVSWKYRNEFLSIFWYILSIETKTEEKTEKYNHKKSMLVKMFKDRHGH